MLHAFTKNYNDLSTEAGFQYEFYCDCCGNGFKSTFRESSTYNSRKRTEGLGRGAGLIGNLFGGVFGSLGNAIESGSHVIRDRMEDRSPQWRREQEQSFDEAQAEVKNSFTKCPSCNQWVCSDCWNEEEGLCITCAPRESSYVAKARNESCVATSTRRLRQPRYGTANSRNAPLFVRIAASLPDMASSATTAASRSEW